MAFDYAIKIQGLLAKAERTDNDDEASAYRAKAEELMRKYRIAEEQALAADATSSAPIKHEIVICHNINSDLYHWYGSVFASIAVHTGVRHVTRWQGATIVATVVGYEGDIRYTEFLWTAAYLMFSTRIDPVWDASRTPEENIFLLRNAGIERRRIADLAWGNGTDAAARSKVQRIYIRECARRNEEARATGLSHQTNVYREAYARAFRDTLRRRLQDARDAADSVGGALALHGREDRVDEAFYGLFPTLRPSTDVVPAAAPAAPCAACAKAKSGHCRQHPGLSWTQADERRYQARYNSSSAYAGSASGTSAAEGVTIARGHQRANRLDESGRAIEG